MKYPILPLLVLLVACQAGRPDSLEEPTSGSRTQPPAIHYAPDSRLLHADTLVTGRDSIEGYRQARQLAADTAWIIAKYRTRRDSSVSYQLGAYRTAGGKEFRQLLIMDSLGRRVLEYLAELKPNRVDTARINQRRQEWMALCNAHQPARLVETLYSPSAFYYNHRPPIRGREALVAEYAYMSRPGYQLTLSPLTVEAVQDSLVLEIGQCSGSYPNKYLLVWRLLADGQWYINFDSNS